jgi:hypothetical protein
MHCRSLSSNLGRDGMARILTEGNSESLREQAKEKEACYGRSDLNLHSPSRSVVLTELLRSWFIFCSKTDKQKETKIPKIFKSEITTLVFFAAFCKSSTRMVHIMRKIRVSLLRRSSGCEGWIRGR